jgi:uncharacterized Rossmann fold enzyme
MAAIRAEFGYPEAADRAAARELAALVPARPWRELGVVARNRQNLLVAGCGPGLARLEGPQLDGKVVVACDGATGRLRELGRPPDLVVTDLDGDPADLLWAAAQGSAFAVHAHGDNRPALARLVPGLGPFVHGTHQVEPTPELARLRNVGGFTDGDRAVLLLEELGARAARLVGFEFDADPSRYSHRWDPRTKPAKLAWAKRIVESCHARGKLHLSVM